MQHGSIRIQTRGGGGGGKSIGGFAVSFESLSFSEARQPSNTLEGPGRVANTLEHLRRQLAIFEQPSMWLSHAPSPGQSSRPTERPTGSCDNADALAAPIGDQVTEMAMRATIRERILSIAANKTKT